MWERGYMKIAIAGGTGVVGRHVADAARRRGHDAVVLSRANGVDVAAGDGLESALAGADVVVDVLNTTTLSARKARSFFTTTTKNILAAEVRVGIPHHVALSIVGIDDIDASYYAGKLAQERLLAVSGAPHTIARATQFHEFAEQIAARASFGRITLAPRLLCRPVAAREVAEHLVDVAERAPAGRAPDLVGPESTTLADMIRRMSTHDGTRRRVVEARFPGAYGAGLASGALRGSGAPLRVAEQTFDEWLRTPDHHG